jgi:hypothetical protein
MERAAERVETTTIMENNMAFEIGQEVECIDDRWGLPSILFTLPVKGGVYVVINIMPPLNIASHQVDHLELAGFPNHCFACDMFRPLLKKRTDISVFTKMLKPKKVSEDA